MSRARRSWSCGSTASAVRRRRRCSRRTMPGRRPATSTHGSSSPSTASATSRPTRSRTARARTCGSTRLEGFHWGRYTSGNWRQALWLALIPFGMVNAAQFMLSPPSTWWERFFHTVVGGALRLLAFGLTATFALAGASISIDLVARQRLADTRLGEALGEGTLLAARRRWPRPWRCTSSTGWGGATRPCASRRRRPTPSGASLGDTSGLTRKNFYAGDPDATSLGRLHLAGGWATVALVGSLTDGDAQLDRTSLGFVRVRRQRGLSDRTRRAGGGARATRSTAHPGRGSATRRWRGGAGCFQHPRVGLTAAPHRAGGPPVVGGHAGAARGERPTTRSPPWTRCPTRWWWC